MDPYKVTFISIERTTQTPNLPAYESLLRIVYASRDHAAIGKVLPEGVQL